MISYEESQLILRKFAQEARILEGEEINLRDAVGRILAEKLEARETIPSFDNSAMDGYAIKLEQLSPEQKSGKDWIPIWGLVAAGDQLSGLSNQAIAVEIMTGAPLPSSEFTTVVRIEDTESKNSGDGEKEIRLRQGLLKDENIRRAGEDIHAGDNLFEPGMLIHENHLLILATQGISKLRVRRKIEIDIISTGKELADYETKSLGPGMIRNSTGVYLECALNHKWSDIVNWGVVEDKVEAYQGALVKALDRGADVIVSTGAVSMGVFDFVRPALEEMGAEVHFHKCAIRPGKPILFATLYYKKKIRFIFGVPGNPVSTAVGCNFFVKPFLYSALGIDWQPSHKMVLAEGVKKPEGLRCFFKAKVVEKDTAKQVRAMRGQASFMVSPLAQANAWLVLPEQGTFVEPGQKVEVFPI